MSASIVVIEDLFERLPAVNDENAYVDELAEKEKKKDLHYVDSEKDFNQFDVHEVDNGLDDYQFGDDNSKDLNDTDDKDTQDACYGY